MPMSRARKKSLPRWAAFVIPFLLVTLLGEVCAASVRPFEWSLLAELSGILFGLFCLGFAAILDA
jgi:hypothetical protein